MVYDLKTMLTFSMHFQSRLSKAYLQTENQLNWLHIPLYYRNMDTKQVNRKKLISLRCRHTEKKTEMLAGVGRDTTCPHFCEFPVLCAFPVAGREEEWCG